LKFVIRTLLLSVRFLNIIQRRLRLHNVNSLIF